MNAVKIEPFHLKFVHIYSFSQNPASVILPSSKKEEIIAQTEEGLPSRNWFITQYRFWESMKTTNNPAKKRKAYVLQCYSRFGDEIVNSYLRGTLTVAFILKQVERIRSRKKILQEAFSPIKIFYPLTMEEINEENAMEAAIKYSKEFIEAFSEVPPLDKPVRLFRGVRIPSAGNYAHQKGYISTTYEPNNTEFERFMGIHCCVVEYNVPAGVRALWMEPQAAFAQEREILLDANIELEGKPVIQEKWFPFIESRDESLINTVTSVGNVQPNKRTVIQESVKSPRKNGGRPRGMRRRLTRSLKRKGSRTERSKSSRLRRS